MKQPEKPINIPNILTIIRILTAPLFVIFLLRGLYAYCLLLFALAGISDALDGFIARCFNQKTALGAFLDPIADKTLLTAAFITLAVLNLLPPWLTVIVITRDVIILIGVGIISLTNARLEVRPSLVSKFTTTSQILCVCITLFHVEMVQVWSLMQAIFWITAGLTTLSGLHYIYKGMNILQEASGNTGPER